ncbi:PLP-dependent cysteine synthase family protein [Sphingomonas sp. LY54]|uniref:PLP-dependent cysteine synthase family protein n=1 Tax=Sphingomonas sp. LY54 TaxID=3095343 RepID=UPI002D76DC6F|nr:PLP-dependent cysteine synthase family protein [Sphingomonas sp. LY54]WRP29486.1 PLP-dependent cysteine synthase family protein [Sphingomonas sp. LY54]
MTSDNRSWSNEAIRRIEADVNRSADTHLIRLDLPGSAGCTLYLKDESVHPTGSLKHRLARSLFLYALCNNWLHEGRPVIEASSGSTAVSEAYFARLIGVPFVAVVPKGTSPEKLRQIEFYGGECRLIDDPCMVIAECHRLATELGGHFMDQFTYAERATDWRGNNNIAQSIFEQMELEEHPIPAWVVCGAGTGGTSATIGRFIRYCQHDTQLCVVDPENSVFADYYESRDPALATAQGSRIEGIGRPRPEESFMPDIVDRMMRVPDAASIAAMHFVSGLVGRRCGGSTGTNFWGCLQLMQEMRARGECGSIVTLLCDSGERYQDTYYNPDWIAAQGLDVDRYTAEIEALLAA